MKPVLILQHTWHDTPDYFADFLNQHGIAYELRELEKNTPVPSSAEHYSGICLLGGSMSANDGDTLPWLYDEIRLIQNAMSKRIPVIGHCLGGQLMAKALGGTVQASPAMEIGWGTIDIHDHAYARLWFGAKAKVALFQWHGESFSIPENAHQIASSVDCPNQAFVFDEIHLAMQFHCEIKTEKLRCWVDDYGDDIERCLALGNVQNAGQIKADTLRHLTNSIAIADGIYHQWTKALRH